MRHYWGVSLVLLLLLAGVPASGASQRMTEGQCLGTGVIYIGTVTGHFFPNPTNNGAFTAKPGDTEAFSQTFPAIDFNPPVSAGVPCSNATGVSEITQPFTDVVPQPDGTCLVIAAQGNGQQAGVDGTPLRSFNAVFRGQLSVSAAGPVTFNFYSDDGWILGVGPEQTAGVQPTFVSGPMANAPPAGPFSGYSIVGSYNIPSSPAQNNLVVNFPEAGTYPFELDYSECCGGQLALTLNANGAIITPSYTIAASAGPGGSISPSGSVPVCSGGGQTFAIASNACYRIADVTVDGKSVGAVTAYTFSNVTANHTIDATFAISPPSTIMASAGSNGAISPSGAVSVNCGSPQAFTITSDACYHVADVLVDGSSVGALTSYTFTNVTVNHTIAASFASNAVSTITASAGACGSISPSGSVTVACGSNNQVFTITPDPCCHVADVVVDGSSVGAVASHTFTNVTANHTITVTFAQDAPSTITASAGPNGTISPSGAVSVNCGSNKTFTVTPDLTYAIADVLVDGSSVGPVATYTFNNVTSDQTITASFKPVGGLSLDCGKARAVPSQLWPPNHALVPVTIAGVIGPSNSPVTIAVTGVTQDEPVNDVGDGNTCPYALLTNGAVQLRAERSGKGNGRVYTISFTATSQGGACNGSVTVCVPHDQSQAPAAVAGDPNALRPSSRMLVDEACVDDGLKINSLGPCPPKGHGESPTGVTLTAGPRTGGTVSLEYFLPAASEVTIALYDIAGRRVAALARAPQGAGAHQVTLGLPSLANGMYFARMQADGVVLSKSVLILK